MADSLSSIKQYETGSGHRILKGKTGTLYTGKRGSIIVSKAAVVGIDEHLWLALQRATEAVGICVIVNSIDTSHHVPGSRHFVGCAADMDMIGSDHMHLRAATLLNGHAVALVKWLSGRICAGHD